MSHPAKRSWNVPRDVELVPGRRVVDRLGGGRRTEVYRCLDSRTGSTVAVKLLRPGRTDAGDVRMLRREAETLAALEHPAFPRLLDSDVAAVPAWIAMSFAEGTALPARVSAGGTVTPADAGTVAFGIADALAHLHVRGRVHLDVKPSNILLGSARPFLLDLGASRFTERAATLRPGVGTRAWLSPEQADPARFGPAGPPSDLWGLGMVLLYATTGHNPLEARRGDDPPDEADLARACLKATASVPGNLRDLVRACLALHPPDRPTAADVRGAAITRSDAPSPRSGSLR